MEKITEKYLTWNGVNEFMKHYSNAIGEGQYKVKITSVRDRYGKTFYNFDLTLREEYFTKLNTYLNDITTNPNEWGTFEEWLENVKLDFEYNSLYEYGPFHTAYILRLKKFYEKSKGE